MKYYVLEQQMGNHIPNIINWYDKLDVRKINKKHHNELPSIIMLDIKRVSDTIFPDMIFYPIFLVSKEVMEVIKMYDDMIIYHSVVLNDVKETGGSIYFLPILEEILDASELKKNSIILGYKVDQNKRNIVIRGDLLESILFRETIGISLHRM